MSEKQFVPKSRIQRCASNKKDRRRESENVEAVDKLIEALAVHISEVISSGKEREHEVAEKTKALAELVSARALYFQKPCIESVEKGVMRAVSSAIHGTGEEFQG